MGRRIDEIFEEMRKENESWNRSDDFLKNCRSAKALKKPIEMVWEGVKFSTLLALCDLDSVNNNGELFQLLQREARERRFTKRALECDGEAKRSEINAKALDYMYT